MLDRKYVRENIEEVQEALENQNMELDLDEFEKLEEERRDLLYETEQLRHKRNVASDKIGELKRAGEDASQ